MRRPTRPHQHRGFAGNADVGSEELIIRASYVRIQSLPDDFRNAPLEFNLKQTIVIPDCAKEPSRLAKVLALGEAKDYIYSVAVGDIVLCNRYPKSFQVFEWAGEKVALMLEDEILATVEEKDGSQSSKQHGKNR